MTDEPTTAHSMAHASTALESPAMAREDRASEASMELADLVGRTMRRLHRGSREALAPFGLTGSAARVVRLLADGPLRMAAIADRLAVVPRSATDIVDRAETAGVVARRPDPDDRRSTLVELTPAGRLLLDRLDEARRASAASVFDVLDASQRTALVVMLRLVCAGVECRGDGPGRCDPAGHDGPAREVGSGASTDARNDSTPGGLRA